MRVGSVLLERRWRFEDGDGMMLVLVSLWLCVGVGVGEDMIGIETARV